MHIHVKHDKNYNLLGFETRFYNSNYARFRKVHDHENFFEMDPEGRVAKRIQAANSLSNLGRVFGAIPLVAGQIVGISRIVVTVKTDVECYDNSYWNKAKHIARGVTETVGLGFVFTLADVIATFDRFLSQVRKDRALEALYNDS